MRAVQHLSQRELGLQARELIAVAHATVSGGERVRHTTPSIHVDYKHSKIKPVTIGDTRVAGLRFGDRRAMALLSLLAVFRLSVRGFTNRDLRSHLAPLLGLLPGAMTAGGCPGRGRDAPHRV